MSGKFTVGLVFCLVLLACENPVRSPGTALDQIFSREVIRAGYIPFPPTVIVDPNTGELSGHHVETIREIATQAGWSVEFVETDWNGFPAGLATGRFDVSIAPTFVTIPRALSVAFTRPLFYAGNSAIVRAGDEDRFATMKSIDREGIRVAVIQGEAGHEYALNNFDSADLIVHAGSDQFLAFQEVIARRADVALGDAYMTAQFAAEHPEEVTDLFGDEPYNLTPVSWAVSHAETALLNFLDDALFALETQGKLEQFEKEAGATWLHEQVEYVKVE